MFDNLLRTEESQRKVGRFAWAMAWFGLVMGQLHALSRHNTADGKEDLQLPLTRWWSDPARKALEPLLDWADPDTVYLAYGKIWLPVFLAFTLCAFVVIMFGSTALGITLLVKRFRPVTPALLLTLQIPLALGILQFTSMGSAALPVMFAFAILGRRIALGEPVGVRTRRELADPVVA
jgi:hypothetical protein